MNRFLLFIAATVAILLTPLAAQNTVGLLDYNINEAYPGYTLIYPHNQPTVYLLDGCGEFVHSWPDSVQFRPGNTAYLLDDGRLVKTKRLASIAGDPIWGGGGGAMIEIRSWDNDLLWFFELNNEQARLHHDIEVLPNGNILAIAWENKTRAEAIAMGRDTTALADDELWPDYIFEINPENDEIVWEWHAWDHLIQDYDPDQANFGVIADHPERIDVNWNFNNGGADWMHANYLDYNEELDQIMLCVPYFSEMWIIDHSTTTEEAAGSTGGNLGKGGDLVYRFGNAEVYDQGDSTDQLLFFPHNCHWSDVPIEHPFWG
ncbi:MAG: aryl-sulfate sulfotransferase, partial [Bacteroidota bacterium]